ncbi:hypothetical protein G6L37_06370 [Agrobacterium rubi]|nr:hypothetical protein [Agrobacterium rubi]NTF24987.1 hypothetical protein [Agrobacterium rubi]
MTETITIDELIDIILDHLDETDEEYRAIVADKLMSSYNDDQDVLDGIRATLETTRPGLVVGLATGLLTPDYEYEGDGKVSVHRHEDAPSAPTA